MYAFLWRKLPGPWPVKLFESAVLLVGICALLFIVVFPTLDSKLPFNEVTVDDTGVQQDEGTVPVQPTGPAPTTVETPGLGG